MDPPRLAESIDAARRLNGIADYLQEPYRMIQAYDAVSKSAVMSHSYEEALDALGKMCETALKDVTLRRPLLLRTTRDCLKEILDELPKTEAIKGSKIRQSIAKWLVELERQIL